MTSSADPVDPPVPVPNVPGADADARGLPDRSELTARQRFIVDASAMADIGLRTFVASIVGAAMLPPIAAEMIRGSATTRERENLAFYAELAAGHDPIKSFPAPKSAPRIYSRPANPVAEWMANGHVHNIKFASSFEPVNPAMRHSWRRLSRNNVVCAQHWRHDDGPHPTLCLIHGFMGSPYLLNGLWMSLPWFYRSGYDVLLYMLPFHGRRAEKYSPFSGYGYFSHGLTGFAEAMAQAVHDFRSIVDYLEYTGVERIALTGISLGGYTTSLIAAVERRLAAVIANVPVVSVEAEMETWFPANKLFGVGRRIAGIGREEFSAASAYHSPLNYEPLIPKERRLIITGLGDRLAPPEQAELLWRHWDRCDLHWFPGNHILHVSQPDYLRRMSRFLRKFMLDG
ncbi:alpha/beta hydrolase family protein [Mycobacterium sp.]|jgi:pimeloyl-ACP methyl ester carboxylesterase|uniref:alpha/beta hydrolase family protein n=1 Tax=Mycobacterium sp. TaxID=1785 RepID=UPI002D4C1934|nr:prolyl oligopeptidase family serine peptidase [Mycobacterium sp.]HZA12181.1 prolyl oligopeptidase family serine peptidase [Mycobacterium sp.]